MLATLLVAGSAPRVSDARVAMAQSCGDYQFCLTVASPVGGKVVGFDSPDGPLINCPTDCTQGYNYPVNLPAGPHSTAADCSQTGAFCLTATANAGYRFGGWGDDCAGFGASNPCTLFETQNHTVSALFVRQRTLTVHVSGPGEVSTGALNCSSACSQTYDSGTTLTLTASPDPDTTFAGWGGDCSAAGAAPTCTLALNFDATVTADFSALPRLAVDKPGGGVGSVTSSPSGIDCGSTCSAVFPRGTSVSLTATAAGGSYFAGWSGACSGRAGCMVTVDADKKVSADFELNPVLGDAALPPLKPLYPPPRNSLAISIAGNGSVVTVGATHGLLSARGAQASTIQCGLTGFSCYATATPGASVVLRARPGFGAVFKRWTGACAAAGATCRVSLSASRSVTAVFTLRSGASFGATLAQPRVHVRWKRSIGRGSLVVTGSLTRPALLRIQLRRPHGGPLLTESTTLAAGRFRHVTRLFPGVLANGAQLFPGGLMVVVTGRSGQLPLPFLLQTFVIPSPTEGVVRRAFVSSAVSSPPTRSVPAGSTEAWAHFVFQNQPTRRLRLTVTWYWPDGRVLGSAVKSNRPSLVSFLRSNAALPTGAWRAELRAGGRVVSELLVRVR